MDDLLKILSCSELKVMLTIIRKTIGISHPTIQDKRLERAWISQRLFSICCNLSGRAVSSAIESLQIKGFIEVTDSKGNKLHSKAKRRGASRLYFASRLRLVPNLKQNLKTVCTNPVQKAHTIKLKITTKLCEQKSQGIKRISDTERYQQLIKQRHSTNTKNTT